MLVPEDDIELVGEAYIDIQSDRRHTDADEEQALRHVDAQTLTSRITDRGLLQGRDLSGPIIRFSNATWSKSSLGPRPKSKSGLNSYTTLLIGSVNS